MEGSVDSLILVRVMVFINPISLCTHTEAHSHTLTHSNTHSQIHTNAHQATHIFQFTCISHGSQSLVTVYEHTMLLATMI